MFVPIAIQTDYSLLNSLITIDELIKYAHEHSLNTLGILDINLNSCTEFYLKCQKEHINPIIGRYVTYHDWHFYLYAKNYSGLKEMFIIDKHLQEKKFTIEEITNNHIVVLPNEYHLHKNEFKSDVFFGYQNLVEYQNSNLINKVFCPIINFLEKKEQEAYNYFKAIDNNYQLTKEKGLSLSEFIDINWLSSVFVNQINIDFPPVSLHLPSYQNDEATSYKLLCSLVKKGLNKRFNNILDDRYLDRIKEELLIIKQMGFVDYFLIVYDYVLYAKKNDIMVGPGRGSAASSLVAYALGITEIDPIKYNLVFERFLNPERITMPDIDIDFEHTKREIMVDYVRQKYGEDKVAPIITYGTLAAKQALRDIAKVMGLEDKITNTLLRKINSHQDLKTNSKNNAIQELINHNPQFKKMYQLAMAIEGRKKHTSVHAAGIIITDQPLINYLPLCFNGSFYVTGTTMEYLEPIGLLKMDFLALKNLTIIKETLNNLNLKINDIPLDDSKTFSLFARGDTDGIFQFEGKGIKSFLVDLQPSCFKDIIAAVALYRPGPMDNIKVFINRKKSGKFNCNIPVIDDILAETYGVIVYQEQILTLLKKVANFSYAEADNIRRAMSKKKIDLINKVQDKFIIEGQKSGYGEQMLKDLYAQILKFAAYGFNKAHSVAYGLIVYQMAYLKANYYPFFIKSLLDSVLGSEDKVKSYLLDAKKNNVDLLKPDINRSTEWFVVIDNKILLPFNLIKNINRTIITKIISERNNGLYKDFTDLVLRLVKNNMGRDILEQLIVSGACDSFSLSHQTMLNALDDLIAYAEIDSTLVAVPIFNNNITDTKEQLMADEITAYGYYLINHPLAIYQDRIKINNFKQYFDKYITTTLLIDKVSEIKTKKGETMVFLTASDETGIFTLVVFPKLYSKLDKNILKPGKIVDVTGRITKRLADFQLEVTNIVLL